MYGNALGENNKKKKKLITYILVIKYLGQSFLDAEWSSLVCQRVTKIKLTEAKCLKNILTF